MTTFKRIKLGKVKELFEKINKKPVQNKFGDSPDSESVCILTALVLEKDLKPNPFTFEKDLNLTEKYVSGIINGWDNNTNPVDYFFFKDQLQFDLGYADGQAAWKEIEVKNG